MQTQNEEMPTSTGAAETRAVREASPRTKRSERIVGILDQRCTRFPGGKQVCCLVSMHAKG